MAKKSGSIDAIIFDFGRVFQRGINGDSFLWAMYGIDRDLSRSVGNKHWQNFGRGKISESEYCSKIFEDLGIDDNPKWFINCCRGANRLEMEGTGEIIKRLKAQKICLALLTNHAKEWLEEAKPTFKLEEIFQVIVASCYCGYMKPEPEIYQIMLEKLGTDPSRTIMIDDKESNLEPARALGMQTILFESAEKLEKELELLHIL